MIRLTAPVYDSAEQEAVLSCLADTRLSPGPWVERFEEGVAKRTGYKYAVACNSGTLALILALQAYKPKGRYVVT